MYISYLMKENDVLLSWSFKKNKKNIFSRRTRREEQRIPLKHGIGIYSYGLYAKKICSYISVAESNFTQEIKLKSRRRQFDFKNRLSRPDSYFHIDNKWNFVGIELRFIDWSFSLSFCQRRKVCGTSNLRYNLNDNFHCSKVCGKIMQQFRSSLSRNTPSFCWMPLALQQWKPTLNWSSVI